MLEQANSRNHLVEALQRLPFPSRLSPSADRVKLYSGTESTSREFGEVAQTL